MKNEARCSRKPCQGDAEAGFSLVDMLVALTLLAIMSGLMASFTGQFRTIGRMNDDVAAKAEIEALADYLGRAVGTALPLSLLRSDPMRRSPFEGDSSHLRFVTTARQGIETVSLRETEISLQGEGDRRTLVQRFTPRRRDAEVRDAAAMRVELARGINSLRLRFLSYDKITHAPVWSDDWVGENGLPAAVSIDIVAVRDGTSVSAEGLGVLGITGAGLAEAPSGGGL